MREAVGSIFMMFVMVVFLVVTTALFAVHSDKGLTLEL